MRRARSSLPSDAVREAILPCGMARRQIALRTGIRETALSRFVNGHCGITLTTLDKLAPVLGLRLEINRGDK